MAKKLDKNLKIYRGAYQFERNGNLYLEETFDVYKEPKTQSFKFISQLISRVSTGELLTIDVDYTVNNSYIPTHVKINRSLGDELVEEYFRFNHKKNEIIYRFTSKDGEELSKVPVSSKFFIATPAVCTSMLYIRSKKLDTTTKNFYNIVTSQNQWKFVAEPEIKNLAAERVSATPENVTIGGSNIKGVHFIIYDTEKDLDSLTGSDEESNLPVHAYLSEHMTIPYLLSSDDGTIIKVKYLNDFTNRGLD